MAFKPMNIPNVKDASIQVWQPSNLAGGVVYGDLPMNIEDNQSPEMLNMWFKEKVLTKRYGQEIITNIGLTPILSMYPKKFNGSIIFTSGTKMYKLVGSTATVIYSSLTAEKGTFFTFRDKATNDAILYYINGNEYVKYDGTTVSKVEDSAYIPKVVVGRAPTGGGTTLEQYNALSAGFINSFSATGSATAYQLSQTNLDATTVTATLNGTAKVEGTDFTVNRTTGVVTFTVAPTLGTDNLLITAYKTDLVAKVSILANRYAITFGGNNDTRVFLAGSGTTYYYSGLQDPSYWPENQYNNCGSDDSAITGFGKQYDTLVVFKEHSIYAVTYSVSDDGSSVGFPLAPLNDSIGCDMPYTIQLVDNCLTWCTTDAGVFRLVSEVAIKDEKNVKPISKNINGTRFRNGLLQNSKEDLQSAVSIDFWGMYWLCVGDKVYCWDYTTAPYINTGDLTGDQTRTAWFPLDNINANCFIGVDNDLYYGDPLGNVIHFINNYADFGEPINSYFQTKVTDFGVFDWYKYIIDVRFDSRTDVRTNITVEYIYDQNSRIDNKIETVFSFRWDTFNWAAFTWGVVRFAKTFHKRPKVRNTVYFSVKFSNNEIGQNLSLLNVNFLWIPTKRVI